MKVKKGDLIDPITIVNIKDEPVSIPTDKYVHLQFRRFSGCPICNMHLQEFIRRKNELESVGIQEVVFFHSSKENLLDYQGHFPFDIIADPDKTFYKQFGVETSISSILNPKAMWAGLKGVFQKSNPKLTIENGVMGLPADFLIDSKGKIIAVHYGQHAYDQWEMEDVLAEVSKVQN